MLQSILVAVKEGWVSSQQMVRTIVVVGIELGGGLYCSRLL